MSINDLPHELLSIPAIPDDGQLAAIVGDVLTFIPQQTFASPSTTLTRKPAGSAASVTSNAFTADLAGYYTVTVAAGGFTRTITAVVFPASVLTQKVRAADVASPVVSRTALTNLIHDPLVTLTTIGTALEGGATFTLAAIVGGRQTSWTSYAPG